MADQENGRWITSRGRRIFIKDGESIGDAINSDVAEQNESTKDKQIARAANEANNLNGKVTKKDFTLKHDYSGKELTISVDSSGEPKSFEDDKLYDTVEHSGFGYRYSRPIGGKQFKLSDNMLKDPRVTVEHSDYTDASKNLENNGFVEVAKVSPKSSNAPAYHLFYRFNNTKEQIAQIEKINQDDKRRAKGGYVENWGVLPGSYRS